MGDLSRGLSTPGAYGNFGSGIKPGPRKASSGAATVADTPPPTKPTVAASTAADAVREEMLDGLRSDVRAEVRDLAADAAEEAEVAKGGESLPRSILWKHLRSCTPSSFAVGAHRQPHRDRRD